MAQGLLAPGPRAPLAMVHREPNTCFDDVFSAQAVPSSATTKLFSPEDDPSQKAWLRRQVFDLRFNSKRDEIVFLKDCEKDLLPVCIGICTVVGVLTSAGTAHYYYLHHKAENVLLGTSMVFSFVCWLSMAFLSAVFATLCLVQTRFRVFTRIHWEGMFIAFAVYIAIVFLLSNRWFAPLLFGEDPAEVWNTDTRDSAVHAPMVLDIGLTFVVLYIPIRSCIMWILPAFAVCVYSILQFSLPAAFPAGRYMDVGLLLISAVFAYHGCFRHDRQRRETWVAKQSVRDAQEHVNSLEIIRNSQVSEIAELKEQVRVTMEEHKDHIAPLPGALPAPTFPEGTIAERSLSASGNGIDSDSEPPSFGSGCTGSETETSSVLSATQMTTWTSLDTRPCNGDRRFDGQWLNVNHNKNKDAGWLRYLEIRGDVVMDGMGRVHRMSREAHGDECIARGRITLVGETLYRQGERSFTKFRQKPPTPRIVKSASSGNEVAQESGRPDDGTAERSTGTAVPSSIEEEEDRQSFAQWAEEGMDEDMPVEESIEGEFGRIDRTVSGQDATKAPKRES